MIRVAIYAASLFRAQAIAGVIGADERIDIADVRALQVAPADGSLEMIDVVVWAGPRLDRFPADGPPMVVLSNDTAPDEAWLRSVRAWLPENASDWQLTAAIEAAAAGLALLTEDQVTHAFAVTIDRNAEDSRPGQSRSFQSGLARPIERLTPRESEVLQMLSAGLGNKEIATELGVSEHTAKFHVGQILGKLGVTSRAGAVAAGIRLGLVSI